MEDEHSRSFKKFLDTYEKISFPQSPSIQVSDQVLPRIGSVCNVAIVGRDAFTHL